MIKPGEIQNVARRAGVRDQQIEKDYILSWILQGIAQHKKLSKALAFKGGTVLLFWVIRIWRNISCFAILWKKYWLKSFAL
jgi:hypothetical protein